MNPIKSPSKKTAESSSSASWQWLSRQVRLSPQLPGVYWFRDKSNTILYIGKARNLKKRLGSYARIKPAQHHTYQLVSLASRVSFKVLSNELEALLVEAQLIKAHQPKFNRALKDDRSNNYLVITKDIYPKIFIARGKQLSTEYSHLPESNIFGPFSRPKALYKLTRQIFKFCSQPSAKGQLQPCFYTHLNLCLGACLGKFSPEEYQNLFKHIKRFLRGNHKRLLQELKHQMRLASRSLDFETAAVYRDRIGVLQSVSKNRTLPLDPPLPVLEEDVYLDQLKKLSHLLHQVGLVPQNYSLERIEAYDASHLQDQHQTASMVVFLNGRASPRDYRKFRLKNQQNVGDTKRLEQVLVRRLNHPEWDYPQVILVDGGKSQLNAARKVVSDQIPTISLVKNPDRLIIPKLNAKNSYTIVRLRPGHPVANITQSIRDEAHRFAKAYQTHLHRRSQVEVS